MISRLIFLVLLAAAAFGQVTAVLIQDTLRVPVNGELFRGRVQITPPNVVCGGQSYKPVPVNVQVSGGVLSVSLVPNEQCSPAGTVYHVRFQAQQGARWEEVWRVPVSLVPITLEDVYLTTGGPSPGGGGASIWGQITGTLGDQTDLAAALNGRAPISHTHLPGDITGLQATVRGYVSASAPLVYDSETGNVSCPTCVWTGGSYANPSWITSFDWSKVSNVPDFTVELVLDDDPPVAINRLTLITGTDMAITKSCATGDCEVTINSTAEGGTAELVTITETGTWTVPAGVNRVFVEVWGPGGNGAGSNWEAYGGTGGGGGGYVAKWCAVTPAAEVSVTVGTGGSGTASAFGSCASATAGENGAANGGLPGYESGYFLGWLFTSDTSGTLVSSGAGNNQVGRVAMRLDQGGNGAGRRNVASNDGMAGGRGFGGGGGGGGGAIGTTNHTGGVGGGSARGGTGGTGGSVVAGVNVACTDGAAPGGGGGGGGTNQSSPSQSGCAGGRGEVRIWY